MVNLGERNIFDNYYSIHNKHSIHCYICKVVYKPTKNDISTKNPNVFYKACSTCRKIKFEYFQNYRLKKEKEKMVEFAQ